MRESIEILVVVILLLGVLFLILGAYFAFCFILRYTAELNWKTEFNKQKLEGLRQSEENNWNTSEPPKNKYIIAKSVGWDAEKCIRKEGRIYNTHGSSFPLESLTGWLFI